MADDMGERTELPTSRKLAEARNRGQVVKSSDLAAAIDLSGAVILIAMLGGAAVAVMGVMMRRVFEGQIPGVSVRTDSIDALVMYVAVAAAKILGPGMLVLLAVSILSQYVQVGTLFTTEPLQPKIEKLNPIAGFKRLFQARNVVKNGVGIAKLLVVGIVSTIVISSNMQKLVALPALGLLAGFSVILSLMVQLLIWLLAIMLVIGFIDYLYQRRQHTEDNKMTKQEVQDERRSMDGDPDVKARRMRMARDISMQRIRRDVPGADVIVTNPTHFSVALRYDQDTMRAPRVVAKGADELAFRIREIARAHTIPIVERPPLARGLYWGVEVGQEVPAEFYEAVAEVLAFVYRLESGVAPATERSAEPAAAAS